MRTFFTHVVKNKQTKQTKKDIFIVFYSIKIYKVKNLTKKTKSKIYQTINNVLTIYIKLLHWY